jgi:sulfonate transport system ATP-binding protein
MHQSDNEFAVKIDRASVELGGREIIKSLSMVIKKGQITALLGPSGSGKSTVLRMISRAVASKGVVEVYGKVGVVYQDMKLLPWLTVEQNITFNRKSNKLVRGYSLDALLRLAKLSDRLTAYPYQLSGGQQQRVAIFRALWSGAELMLLDEPFSSLDFLSKADMIRLIKKLNAEFGLSVLVVAHDTRDVLRIANRVLVMRDGQVAFSYDDLEKFRSRPDDFERAVGEVYLGGSDAD